jgi:folate-binding protein YgfZ
MEVNAAQYDAAVSHAGVIRRHDRVFLRMFGRDPMRIIQGIVTNDIANAPLDRAVYAALLSPKGRMLADMRIMRRKDDLLLDVPAAALDALLESFRKTIPPLFARFEICDPPYALLSVCGPHARDVVEQIAHAAGTDSPAALSSLPARDGFALLRIHDVDAYALTTQDTGTDDCDLVVPAEMADLVQQEIVDAGAAAIDAATFDVLRIEAGTPRWGAELNDATIPLEAGLQERAISTGKGCYTGQEVIIRILHRGHVNWHLRGLLLGAEASVAPGAELVEVGATRAVARITSVAYSPRLKQNIALGYVRREVVPSAVLATPSGDPATVIELPFRLA